MSVSLSIKNVPEELLAKLRRRAQRNHRSLQGELLAILHEAGQQPRPLDVEEIAARARALQLPDVELDAVDILRRDRDGDHGRG